MKYVVGIDGGSQSSKVTIYDIEGNEICSGQEPLKPMYIADPFIAEHPDDDLWDSIGVASKKALAKFPFDLNDIIGIGVGSIRCCRVLLKKMEIWLLLQLAGWMLVYQDLMFMKMMR